MYKSSFKRSQGSYIRRLTGKRRRGVRDSLSVRDGLPLALSVRVRQSKKLHVCCNFSDDDSNISKSRELPKYSLNVVACSDILSSKKSFAKSSFSFSAPMRKSVFVFEALRIKTRQAPFE